MRCHASLTTNSTDNLFRKFVERIQFRVWDHPSKLEARIYAWSRVNYEHCDATKLFDKAKQLCVQFDEDANATWKAALDKIISCCKTFLGYAIYRSPTACIFHFRSSLHFRHRLDMHIDDS